MLIKKRRSTADGVENIIISLYAKIMSTSDIDEQIRKISDFNILLQTLLNRFTN